jgi:Tol biopolymer transport system component
MKVRTYVTDRRWLCILQWAYLRFGARPTVGTTMRFSVSLVVATLTASNLVLGCDPVSPENSSEGPGSNNGLKRPNSLIVFSRDGMTGQSIYSVQPDGSQLRLIARGVRPPRYRPGGVGFRDPAWSPDGQSLAYVRHDGHDPGTETLEVARWDGSDPHQIIPPERGQVWEFAWSPLGDQLAYVRPFITSAPPPPGLPASPGAFALYTVKKDGTEQLSIPHLTYNGYPSFLCPSWSPDGTRIAFVNQYDALWITRPDGTDPRRVFAGAAPECARWSPDGTRLAFVNDRNHETEGVDGRLEIYLVNPDGGGLTNLTNPLESDYEPVWSPDGTRLAFARAGGVSGIFHMQPDGTGIVRLTSGVGIYPKMVWSPDGTQLAFVSGFATQRDIYVINADGRGLRNLTNSPEDEYELDWR